MSAVDPYEGVRTLPAHDDYRGPAIGETVWLLEDCGTLWGVWPTRHDAIGGAIQLANTNCYKEEWFTPLPVPAGAVRLTDIRKREGIDSID